MPAALPGATPTANANSNPSTGAAVIFDLLSGPKGSPFDKDVTGNASTGALSTGIGFGPTLVMGNADDMDVRGFSDNYTVGVTRPNGTTSTNSTLMYIGGGRSTAAGDPNPYTAGFGVGAAGNSNARDAGTGPVFTGYRMKTVTASGSVANGAAVESGWLNRSGASLTSGRSVFGVSSSATAAVA